MRELWVPQGDCRGVQYGKHKLAAVRTVVATQCTLRTMHCMYAVVYMLFCSRFAIKRKTKLLCFRLTNTIKHTPIYSHQDQSQA